MAVGVMLDAQGSRIHHDDIACGCRPMYPERSPSKTQYAEGPFKHATVFGVFLNSGLGFHSPLDLPYPTIQGSVMTRPS